MKPGLLAHLGRYVWVVVDRPLGSAHPRHPDLTCPVNDGELPGTVSGDGQPIDVYLLGWTELILQTWGTVTAVIVRHDDREDKLVVARDGTSWTDEEITKAVAFQERYFRVTLAR